MNKSKKPSAKSVAKGRKPAVRKGPIRDLDLSDVAARQVKGGLTQRKAGGDPS